MDVSSQMLTFVKVVNHGSISAASRLIGQTPSAVSKQISNLENHVGHRLLHRRKSGVSLTDEGREYFEKCNALAEKFDEAEELVSNYDSEPKGKLRIASSVAFGKSHLIPKLPKFLNQYPQISFSLELTDREIDPEEESFDATITFPEQLPNPNLIARKIMTNERVLCAAPLFIETQGMPESFSDLENYNCLRTSNAIDRNAWNAKIDGVSCSVNATGNFEGNSAHAVYLAALAGMGVARLSSYLVADSIASGGLVQLFPTYTQKHADVAVVFAGRNNLAPKTRAFVTFLMETFTGS